MTPHLRSTAVSDASLLRAPRSLNELVTCRFSYLTCTDAPVSAESFGAGSIGVRITWPAMARRAASMSANVMLIPRLLKPGHRRNGRASGTRIVYAPAVGGSTDWNRRTVATL